MKEIILRMRKLEEEIRSHQYLYYVENKPKISDHEFDLLFTELKKLENEYPSLASINSPTRIVGSDLSNQFEKINHKIPVLSLENTYSNIELLDWSKKIGQNEKYSVEWKVDGASVVLYYENGELFKGVSRGSGGIGDDITENIRTIKSVPMVLSQKVTIYVRGEIYMSFSDFEEFNKEQGGKYANPRNLVSGSIKHKHSSQVARRPLKIVTYDAYLPNSKKKVKTHEAMLLFLQELQLPVSNGNQFVKGKDLEKTIDEFRIKKDSLDFPTDGLVIKLDDLQKREELGTTSHSPRWARALKFEALVKESKIINIDFAVGRTGKITPRAEIEPVALAGTTVRYATLHNQDYIEELGVGIGAIVKVAKRGEIIPAVEEVVSPPAAIFSIPSHCPSCNSLLQKIDESVDLFCINKKCPDRIRESLVFFCQKKQMNIDGLGEKQIENLFTLGFLNSVIDIYDLQIHREKLENLDGLGKKSVQIILDGIEKSKQNDFKLLLPALGFSEIGHKVTEILLENGFDSIDKLKHIVKEKDGKEKLLAIHGLGERTVSALLETFTDKDNLKLFDELKKRGLKLEGQKRVVSDIGIFAGQTWCVTGSFENFQPREKAMELVVLYGGKKVGSVSKNTTHLLAGESFGSKLDKARELGVKIVSEKDFLEILNQSGVKIKL
jgi:DNA ligase (NAD+)